MSGKVEVPRSLLFGLVGVTAVAVLGLVFLLGRESARRTPPGPQVAGGSGGTTGTPPSIPAEIPLAGSQPSLEPPTGGPAPGVQVVTPVGPPPPLSPGRDVSEQAAVAAYFQAVEQLQPGSLGDPEAMAQKVLGGLAKGDASGFDDMVKQTQSARHRLAALAPPLPCASYHLNSLASLDAGLDLLRGLKKAMASPELDAQTINLLERAQSLKARSEALQAQEKSLRQRFGLMKS